MKVGVVGAGAIGGWVGARLAAAGHEISAVARGATLAALRERGLSLDDGDGVKTYSVHASDVASDLGAQDIILLAVKGPALKAVAPAVAALLKPDAIVLSMMNGVPWWFFANRDKAPINAVDPDGAIAAAIPVEHVVGCVVHASCAALAPGSVVRKMGNALILGEPTGGKTARLERIADALQRARFDVAISEHIQSDIWYKLWGNMTMNPISALTGVTCDRILDDDLVRAFILQVMEEAKETGRRIGCEITESGEDRNAVTRRLGAFKTSMLQDVEAGRALEIDALVAAPREIAQSVGVMTPGMDALLGLTRLFARGRGLYHA